MDVKEGKYPARQTEIGGERDVVSNPIQGEGGEHTVIPALYKSYVAGRVTVFLPLGIPQPRRVRSPDTPQHGAWLALLKMIDHLR